MDKEKKTFSNKILRIFNRDYSRWESRSKRYLDDKESARKLLFNARRKADEKSTRFKGIWENIQLLFSFVKDWNDGIYRTVTKQTIVIMIAGIVYFVVPTDIVPDFIIALGLADDAVILGFILKQVENELQKYKEWKNKQNIELHE